MVTFPFSERMLAFEIKSSASAWQIPRNLQRSKLNLVQVEIDAGGGCFPFSGKGGGEPHPVKVDLCSPRRCKARNLACQPPRPRRARRPLSLPLVGSGPGLGYEVHYCSPNLHFWCLFSRVFLSQSGLDHFFWKLRAVQPFVKEPSATNFFVTNGVALATLSSPTATTPIWLLCRHQLGKTAGYFVVTSLAITDRGTPLAFSGLSSGNPQLYNLLWIINFDRSARRNRTPAATMLVRVLQWRVYP